MTFERDAFFGQLSQIREAHDLKPTRIGQNRTVPIHEFVQSAQLRNALGRGTQHQVIRVAKQNVGTGFADTFGHHGLYGRRRTNRHERRRANIAARRRNKASTGCAVLRIKGKCELCHLPLMPWDVEKAKPRDINATITVSAETCTPFTFWCCKRLTMFNIAVGIA